MNYYARLNQAPTLHEKNTLLLDWLSDDVHRPALYGELRRSGLYLPKILSCAKRELENGKLADQFVHLLTHTRDIDNALANGSSSPYQALGGGTFVLAMDNGEGHEEQRRFLMTLLHTADAPAAFIEKVNKESVLACRKAMVRPGKLEEFDLVADVAEPAALHFVSALFGFPRDDYGLLLDTMRRTHQAMIAQMFSRHFAPERLTIEAGKLAMGQLTQRVAALIAEATRTQPTTPPDQWTLIEKLARNPGDNSGSELAIAVVGMIAGIVGNIIASASIAIDRYFKLSEEHKRSVLERVRAALSPDESVVIANTAALLPFIRESLRLQPPAPFIPRRTTAEVIINADGKPPITIEKGTEVIVALGAATRGLPDSERPDEYDETRTTNTSDYVFGQRAADDRSHRCIGEHIALPLIAHIVRSALSLPGLAPAIVDGRPATLRKRRGFICESYQLQWQRNDHQLQRPLNVVMKIKAPTAEHAEKLRQTIRHGAADIEFLLRQSKLVHFARFIFLNGDTELALLTTYQGGRKEYLEYFAKAAGPLFDRIFIHIQDAPPMPVGKHAEEFATHIARYDIPPVEGYFFSAYPQRTLQWLTS